MQNEESVLIFFVLLLLGFGSCAVGGDTFPIKKTESESDIHPVYCEADYLEYAAESRLSGREEENIVEGHGNVAIFYKNVEIHAQHIRIHFKNSEVRGWENISLISENNKITGDSMTYNLKTKKGDIFNASTSFEPIYYHGEKIEKISDEELNVKRGLFTTCSLQKPHYRLQASKINVCLNERIVAQNVAIYVGSVPVFYLPILAFPLREGRPSWLIPSIGYSQSEGWYAKVGYNYSPVPSVYGNVFLKYMEKKGLGLGSESEIIQAKWYGASSLYYVKQYDSGRYKVNLKAQPVSSNTFFYLYLLSDTSFDREYGTYFGPPSNWVNRKFTAYVSYSKTFDNRINLKLNIKSQESKEGLSSSLPQLKLFTYPSKIGNFPLYTSWTSGIGNYLVNNENYFLLNNRLDFVPESMKIMPCMTLSSKFSLVGVYWNENKSGGLASDSQGLMPGYKITAGPRLRVHRDLLFDISYNLDSEMEEDTYSLAPISKQYIRTLFSYTGRIIETSLSGNYLLSADNIWERFDKVRFELCVNPSGRLRFYSTTKYNVFPQSVQNISFIEGRMGNLGIKFGSQYFAFTSKSDSAPLFDLTNEISFTFGKYRFIFSGSYDLMFQKFRDRDYIITRDLHCWEASLIFRELRQEVWFQIGIKAFPGISASFHPSIF